MLYSLLENMPEEEEEALLAAVDRAERGVMNYYVGWRKDVGMKVFDGAQWLNRDPESEGFQFLWGVWPDGTLILNP